MWPPRNFIFRAIKNIGRGGQGGAKGSHDDEMVQY
jgi:hypothetical protein